MSVDRIPILIVYLQNTSVDESPLAFQRNMDENTTGIVQCETKMPLPQIFVGEDGLTQETVGNMP